MDSGGWVDTCLPPGPHWRSQPGVWQEDKGAGSCFLVFLVF